MSQSTKELYIGLISGTSMDAVDSVLVEINDGRLQLLEHHSKAIPAELKQKLRQLCTNTDTDLRVLGNCDIAVATLFAAATTELLEKAECQPGEIMAIGSHGQTIWHEPPNSTEGNPFSLQIGDPNTIAELTGITTVADFRRRDMAAGGQGAPLVPALHLALFNSAEQDRIVLNLGGIANITFLPKTGHQPLGFDTGPANVLMDEWINRHRGLPYDEEGRWADSAKPDSALLQVLLQEPYFSRPSPKSTGRELFNLNWLDQQLTALGRPVEPAVVQATLAELTCESVAMAVEKLVQQGELLVCGGGARNTGLLRRLHLRLPLLSIKETSDFGLHADFVEATAFAWFASRTLNREPMPFHPFTGAEHAVIAGGIYLA